MAWLLFHAVGISAYGAALAILTVSVLACVPSSVRFAPLAMFGWALVGTATSGLAHLICDPKTWGYPPGGALGRAVGDAARGAFSITGSLVVMSALLLMAILLATHFAAARAFEYAARGVGNVSVAAAQSALAAYERHRRARLMREPVEGDDDEEYEDERDDSPEAIDPRVPVFAADARDEEEDAPQVKVVPAAELKPAKKTAVPKPPEPVEPASEPRLVLPAVPPDNGLVEPIVAEKKPRAKKEKTPAPVIAPVEAHEAKTEPAPVRPPPPPADATGEFPKVAPRTPAIIEPRAPPKPMPTDRPAVEQKADWRMNNGQTGFHVPAIDDILESSETGPAPIDRAALTSTAAKLVQKLNNLGVQGEVTEIRPGPVVTMYEFKPADGIKLSRIASLGDDLAMAMEALRVRIVAPIPGKGVVGFEVPNRTRETVFLKEVVEQEAFQKGKSRLTMAIGKDIEGMPYVSDLAKMPHLLIAGTTGSGKSVGVNAMLVSMLMHATPEELRFIMVDPKMLELSIYDGIPHLLLPVVNQRKLLVTALIPLLNSLKSKTKIHCVEMATLQHSPKFNLMMLL
jgi:S-DNA-T family DNA segregation ATPase FtsK/SpoIIIE